MNEERKEEGKVIETIEVVNDDMYDQQEGLSQTLKAKAP